METKQNTLKLIRKERNLTAEEVSNLLNISRAHYTHLENGTRNITPTIAKKMATVFNINEYIISEAVSQLKENTYLPNSWILKIRINGEPLLKSFQHDLYEYPLRDSSSEIEFKKRFIKFIMYRLEESLIEEVEKDPKLIEYINYKTQWH